MDIAIKVRRKSHPVGTVASGGCEYSYNLTIKIKGLSKKQIENIRKSVLQATGE